MSEAFTSSEWMVDGGDADAFIAAFTEFLKVGAEYSGGVESTLFRDVEDGRRFIVVSRWGDKDGLLKWHGSDEYDRGIESLNERGAILSRDGVLLHMAGEFRWPAKGEPFPIPHIPF